MKKIVKEILPNAGQLMRNLGKRTSCIDRMVIWTLAFDVTRGNNYTRSFRLAFRAARKVLRNRLTAYAASLRSFDDLPTAQPHTTSDLTQGGARLDHDYSSRFFVFGNSDFMSNGLQDLNLRSVLGGGVGRHLVNRDRATLD
jgi:hypothetical protein